MISRKARPTDGPGANHLRGGAKLFSNKTALGGWIENCGGSQGFQRGFTTENFITESQHQQNGIRKIPMFGAGLPKDSVVEYPTQTTDIFQPRTGPSPKEWESTTRSLQNSLYKPKDEPKQVDNSEYIKTWTTDTVEGRKVRFETESRRANNTSVQEDFRVRSLRFLPGTPYIFEKLLKQLYDRYGIFALSALRAQCGGGNVSFNMMKDILKNLSIQFTKVEFLQLIGHLTHTDSFPSRSLLAILTPKTDEFNVDAVISKFKSLSEGSQSVSIGTLDYLINSENEHPDVVEGVRYFLPTYGTSDNGYLTQSEFILLHLDMYHSYPNKYNSIFQSIWN